MKGYFDQVYFLVSKIPRGKVATYGQIAALLGNPRNGRIVGWAMRLAPDDLNLPCHRIINRNGVLAPEYAFGGKAVQRSLLEDEGVTFEKDGSVDLEKCLWEIHDDGSG